MVRALSDRVAVMYLGHVVEMAPSGRLFARPLHPYTQGLIASVLEADVDARTQLAAAERLAPGDIPSLMNPPTGCRYHTRCPYARERCSRDRPLLEYAEGEADAPHWVACHFWREIDALYAEGHTR